MPTGTLPASGKKHWEQIYNASIKAGDSKETAARKAWSGIKSAGWRKKDGKWSKKSDAIAEMSMYITKASYDGKVMRWSAVNSDTDPDSYEERMSLELYNDFIGRIQQGEKVPEIFKSAACSGYWCGGMPYLSVSHYPDLNGDAVPGKVLELYVDGNKLKAKGSLSNDPLGNAVFRSLKEDKNKPPDEKIRISIGFLDLAHRHGEGKVWVREGMYSLCPECLEGVGQKVYIKGYLVHLALTRVPVNKRTEMVLDSPLEEKSEMAAKKTRKEDAASIVGKTLAEEIDAKSKISTQRSDVLIEMSEGEEPTEEETQELIEEAEHGEGEKKKECMKPDGTMDEECLKKMKEKADLPEIVEPVTEKFEDATMEQVVNEPYPVDNLPYGGAVTIEDAMKYMEVRNEVIRLMDMWSVFSGVIWNILERQDVSDKRNAIVGVIDSFRNALTARAMLAFGATERSEEHELQSTIDALLDNVDNSVSLANDVERAEAINPSLQQLGTAIMDYLQRKSVANEPPAPDKNTDNLLEKITELIQPLSENVRAVNERLGILEAKSTAQNVEVQRPRVPQPRSHQIPPNLVAKSEPKTKPGSLRDIINKSVGITE